VDDVMGGVARLLFELTYATQVVVSLENAASKTSQAYEWDGDSPVRIGSPSADISLVLTETSEGQCRLLAGEDLSRTNGSGIAGRSHCIRESELAVFVVGNEGSGVYSDTLVQHVSTVLQMGVLHAALVFAMSRAELAEHTLGEAQQQLSATERYRRQLFSTVTDAFLLVDRAGGVRFSNPAAEPYVVAESNDSPMLRDDLRGSVASLLDSDGIVPHRRVRHSTDDRRHLEIQVSPVGEEKGNLVAVSISDITDTVDREAQLAQQERQLVVADRLASIGMFSASIVHEISNPNHILQLNTQSLLVVLSWLRSEINDEYTAATVAQAGELVEQIEDAAQRVESVLQMVKSYSREGRRERWDVLAPGEVCSRAFRFSKIMASQFTDRFRLSVSEGIPTVWGEAALLEQAVVNLIKNACEALPSRQGRVELCAYPAAEGGEAVIAVCDTGGGFPEGLTDHLGTPFLSDRHHEGGTGLGLSIVSGIVDKHGGSVRVSSDDQFTTRVEIHLPESTFPSDRTSASTG
jgi:signal transduction histidine kinase